MRGITGSIAPTLVMLMMAGASFAQQWQGNGNATDPIGRTGNVGIGTTMPGTLLELYSSGDGAGPLLLSTPSPDIYLETASTHYNWRIAAQEDVNAGLTLGVGAQDDNAIDDTYTSHLTILQNGNVGIGTTSPVAKFDVVGNILFGGTNPSSAGNVQITTGGASPISNRLTYGTDGTGWKFAIGKNQSGAVSDQLVIQDNGNVGIGTSNPTTKLTVKGTITAEEVVVEAVGADFVFKPDYPLMPLDDLEGHIRRQGHLPGLPAAAEMEARGMRLGRMEGKLLEKIEELTLYVIALKKENEHQQNQISRLQHRLDKRRK